MEFTIDQYLQKISARIKFTVMLGLSLINQSRLCIIFYIFYAWAGSSIVAHNTSYYNNRNRVTESKNDGFEMLYAINFLKEVFGNISIFLEDVDAFNAMQPKCVKVQCRIICSNGRQSNIANDISFAIAKSDDNFPCDIIDELYLYNYKFPNAVLPVGFLSTYINKIKLIYLGISNITAIENGAFGGGIFSHIILENLRLYKLDKKFFNNISGDLKAISIIQHNTPIQCVYPDFFDHVVFQIEYLSLQGGIKCVRNVTATDPILGALVHADFSYNNFSDQLREDTFIKLTMVEQLILSFSNIVYLPNYIFQGMKYLEVLDISNNKLITLSKTIFGIHDISRNLRIYASSNNWHCDCELQQEMNEIFIYHSSKLDMYCESPNEYKNWMVFDDRICVNNSDLDVTSSINRTTTMSVITTMTFSTTTTTTPQTKTTTNNNIFLPTISTAGTVNPNDIVPLECLSTTNTFNNNTRNRQSIMWPQINFVPTYFEALTVKISVEQSDSASSFGLFWFSKTTKEYYMMELLPDEFGLGCYFTMPLLTIVTNLMPSTAYTFCLVQGGHNTVSPFSCKSVQIGGNLDTYYDSWLSDRILTKGISLMILGIVVFMLIGIMVMYVVLKKKPMWVKSRSSIVKPKYSSGKFLDLPRNDIHNFRHKENSISQRIENRFSSFFSRRGSMDSSIASSDSYISPNLYEVIPTYITFDKKPQEEAPALPGITIYNNCHWRSSLAYKSSVRYAKITPRTKRISSDPLPAIPADA